MPYEHCLIFRGHGFVITGMQTSGNKESSIYMKFYVLMFIMATIGYKTRTEMSVN